MPKQAKERVLGNADGGFADNINRTSRALKVLAISPVECICQGGAPINGGARYTGDAVVQVGSAALVSRVAIKGAVCDVIAVTIVLHDS